MANLPSGMSVADAEALSRQQQAVISGGQPPEGSFFQMSAGEGANRLYQRRGNTIIGLGFKYPSDWQGRTIGSFLGEQTGKGIAGLGLSNVPVIGADFVKGLTEKGISDLQQFISSSKAYSSSIVAAPISPQVPDAIAPVDLATMTGEQYLAAGYYGGQPPTGTPAAPISPVVPESLTPESSLAGIRSVFGASWQPSPAFTPELQARGIFGAVRIRGTNEVYTLGYGGGKETPESLMAKFGTTEQEGIVGLISKEEAIKLGITDTKQTPIAPGGITPEALAPGGETIELPDSGGGAGAGGGGTVYNADTTIAGIEEYIRIQEESKTAEELAKETELETEKDLFKDLLEESEGRGAAQLAEEEEQGVIAKQEALDNANGDLQIKMAEIKALELSYNKRITAIEGKPITLGRMQGQEAQEYRMFLADKGILVAEAGLLQANALALQGKLDSAITAASRAVDLKYMDIEQRLSNQIALIGLLQGELTTIQQTRADALSNYYDQQKIALAEQKATEKANYSTLLSQMNQYPDAGILTTDTLEEANRKITTNSRIYQNQVRLTGTGGGGGGDWQTSTAGGLLGLDKSTASKFDTDLEQEINAVERGDYGREGARERALERLKAKYPGISDQQWNEIIYTGSDTLYPAFPDGYESKIGETDVEKEAKKTQREKGDEDLRSILKGQIQLTGDNEKTRLEIFNFIIQSSMRDVDKERAKFIFNEMWPEGQDKANKQWR